MNLAHPAPERFGNGRYLFVQARILAALLLQIAVTAHSQEALARGAFGKCFRQWSVATELITQAEAQLPSSEAQFYAKVLRRRMVRSGFSANDLLELSA